MEENPKGKYSNEVLIIFNIMIPMLLSLIFYFGIVGYGLIPLFSSPDTLFSFCFDILLYFFTICYSMFIGAIFGFSKYKNKKIFYTYALLYPIFFYLIPTIILFFVTENPFIRIEFFKVFALIIMCVLFELIGVLIKKEVL
ncbi:MAG: hypothetical protein ACTSR8_07975 [Promethearchaeota archaeon]